MPTNPYESPKVSHFETVAFWLFILLIPALPLLLSLAHVCVHGIN